MSLPVDTGCFLRLSSASRARTCCRLNCASLAHFLWVTARRLPCRYWLSRHKGNQSLALVRLSLASSRQAPSHSGGYFYALDDHGLVQPTKIVPAAMSCLGVRTRYRERISAAGAGIVSDGIANARTLRHVASHWRSAGGRPVRPFSGVWPEFLASGRLLRQNDGRPDLTTI